jgi:hypothetical protein
MVPLYVNGIVVVENTVGSFFYWFFVLVGCWVLTIARYLLEVNSKG